MTATQSSSELSVVLTDYCLSAGLGTLHRRDIMDYRTPIRRYKETLYNFHRQFGSAEYYRNAETWARTQVAEQELTAADDAESKEKEKF